MASEAGIHTADLEEDAAYHLQEFAELVVQQCVGRLHTLLTERERDGYKDSAVEFVHAAQTALPAFFESA